VAEPVIPWVCAALDAGSASSRGALAQQDETRPDTVRIQNAIDHCPRGGAVELRSSGDKNAFVSVPLELRPGTTVLLAAGTVLFASRNPQDYDVTPGSCGTVDQNGRGCKPLIHLHRAPDAGVIGDGVIDGRGGAPLIGQDVTWWDLAQRAKRENARQNVPRLIAADESDNFTLYRITLRNSPNFHVIVSRTNGFTAWGVKIDCPATARNTDGIDPSSSTNVSILYSYIRCGDDQVAIKAGAAGPATHITVAHHHFYSGHGMSIGSETVGGVSALDVRDLTIDGADNGLRIKSNSSRGGLVRGVSYQDVWMREVKNPIMIDPFYSVERGSSLPEFQGIVLRNIFIVTPGRITLNGADGKHLSRVTLDGVYAYGVRPGDIRAAHLRATLGPGVVSFKPVGEDVEVAGIPSAGAAPPPSEGRFIPFPGGR